MAYSGRAVEQAGADPYQHRNALALVLGADGDDLWRRGLSPVALRAGLIFNGAYLGYGHLAFEIDVLEPVVKDGALDLDPLGEDEVALELAVERTVGPQTPENLLTAQEQSYSRTLQKVRI